jgi:hypothetical protein
MHIPYECKLCRQHLPNDVLISACKCNHLYHEACISRITAETEQRLCQICHSRWNTLLFVEEPNVPAQSSFYKRLLVDFLVVFLALLGCYIWMGALLGYLWFQHYCPDMPNEDRIGLSAAIGVGSSHVILAAYYALTLPWRTLWHEMSNGVFCLWITFLIVTAIPASLVFLLYQVYVARVASTVFVSPQVSQWR